MKFLPFEWGSSESDSCDDRDDEDDPASMSSEAHEEDALDSDTRSLGAFILELAEGDASFIDSLLRKEENGQDRMKTHYLESGFSPAFVDFVTNCLAKDVNQRCDLSELMNVRDSGRNDE